MAFPYAAVGRASTAGILLPACTVAGYLLGKWLGEWLGWGTAPAYVGAVLGVAAGFWNLFRIVQKLERR